MATSSPDELHSKTERTFIRSSLMCACVYVFINRHLDVTGHIARCALKQPTHYGNNNGHLGGRYRRPRSAGRVASSVLAGCAAQIGSLPPQLSTIAVQMNGRQWQSILPHTHTHTLPTGVLVSANIAAINERMDGLWSSARRRADSGSDTAR